MKKFGVLFFFVLALNAAPSFGQDTDFGPPDKMDGKEIFEKLPALPSSAFKVEAVDFEKLLSATPQDLDYFMKGRDSDNDLYTSEMGTFMRINHWLSPKLIEQLQREFGTVYPVAFPVSNAQSLIAFANFIRTNLKAGHQKLRLTVSSEPVPVTYECCSEDTPNGKSYRVFIVKKYELSK